ncbi:MAG: M20/M25/M40 family metallo-hydrolase [Lachnospiraceae bacterium]|nr:M20/M25/M40 family metallo-hydrolase [Robinsoniella sp.]MDY3766038.1 M20/M25/M40 family metallo-hydrolase [Lachnospiraceae bacterium]
MENTKNQKKNGVNTATDQKTKTALSVNRQRLCEEFAEFVAINSVSFAERQLADRLKQKLLALGFDVREDHAADHYGGNAGNVYGYLKGTIPGPGVLLSAHMDTVQPGIGKKAIFVGDGTITSAGDTILGADDVTGIVEILEGIRCVCESGLPHRDVEVLFPIAEEVYIKGTQVFDFGQIHAREAYVLDLSGPIGTAALQAPTLISFTVTVTGKAAHAGFNPEDGIHAVWVMCRAVSEIMQGRIDEETTLNIGTISGGEASNIVPSSCVCKGEIRSYRHEKALDLLEQIRQTFLKTAQASEATVQLESKVDLMAYQVEEKAQTVRHFQNICDRLGIPCKLTSTFGGSDNNNFLRHGICGIVLSCGMYEPHTVREYTKIQDLECGARLVAELIR